MGRKSQATVEAERAAMEARFNEAVSSKVTSMLPALVEQIAGAMRAAAPVGVVPMMAPPEGEAGPLNLTQPRTEGGDKAFASALALAIGNISTQNTGRPAYVDPAIIEKWKLAREKMMDLLVQCRVTGETPKYRVTKAGYYNETMVHPQWHDPVTKSMRDTFIWWDEVPNEAMEPANEIATKVFEAFLESIGEAISKREDPATPWVRSDKRLFRGMSPEQRDKVHGAPSKDPRVEGGGAPTTGKRERILGSIAPPAVMR